MKLLKISFLAILPALMILSGCTLEEPDVTITKTNLKGEDFSKYVAIGNSLTAGFQSGSLVEDHQTYSFPNLIAGQIGAADFQQPTVSCPGLPAILQLKSVDGDIEAAEGEGTPTNLNLTRPYDNLGIPGIVLADLQMTTTTAGSFSGSDAIDLVLRNPTMGNLTAYQQADLLNPTFVTCWIGNNDVLGFAASGGTSPAAPTDDATFQGLYMQLAAGLDTLATYVAVANIPDVTTIPFFTTIGPKMAVGIAGAMQADTLVQGLFYQKNCEVVATGLTTLTEADAPLITLMGGQYTDFLGQDSTGKWYRDVAAKLGIPVSAYLATLTGIDTTQAFGFHPQNPWPDALALDTDEIETAQDATEAFNGYIATAAEANDFALFDAHALFNTIAQSGYHEYGVHLTSDFIVGGILSLDGVHPSNVGYGVVANEFIEVINAKFNVNIAPVNLRDIMASQPLAKVNPIKIKHNIFTLSPTIEMLGGKIK